MGLIIIITFILVDIIFSTFQLNWSAKVSFKKKENEPSLFIEIGLNFSVVL